MKTATLSDAIDEALRSYRRGCSHESDIADEIGSALKKTLDEFGILNTPAKPEELDKEDPPECRHCCSTELVIKHQHWCSQRER